MRSFVYVPQAANILREREQHVQLLEQQLTRPSLARRYQPRARRVAGAFSQAEAGTGGPQPLGSQLNEQLASAQARVAELQAELAQEQAAAER